MEQVMLESMSEEAAADSLEQPEDEHLEKYTEEELERE